MQQLGIDRVATSLTLQSACKQESHVTATLPPPPPCLALHIVIAGGRVAAALTSQKIKPPTKVKQLRKNINPQTFLNSVCEGEVLGGGALKNSTTASGLEKCSKPSELCMTTVSRRISHFSPLRSAGRLLNVKSSFALQPQGTSYTKLGGVCLNTIYVC